MRSRAGLVTGVLVAVATGAVAVALGVTLLLIHIVYLRYVAARAEDLHPGLTVGPAAA